MWQLQAGRPQEGSGDPGEGGSVAGDGDRKGRPPRVRPCTWAGGGCPGSNLHRQWPWCLRPAETPSPGQRSRPLGTSCRLEVTHLEGSQELPARRGSRRQDANLAMSCPVRTQIMKTGLETAGLGPQHMTL